MSPTGVHAKSKSSPSSLLYVSIIITVIVLIGCGLNDLNDKYARYKSNLCQSGVLVLNIEESEFCCDDPLRKTEWICVAAYDDLNRMFTSMKAAYIPLLPLICTFLIEVGILFMTSDVSVHGWKNVHSTCIDTFNRLKWSVAIIIYRMVMLTIYTNHLVCFINN